MSISAHLNALAFCAVAGRDHLHDDVNLHIANLRGKLDLNAGGTGMCYLLSVGIVMLAGLCR